MLKPLQYDVSDENNADSSYFNYIYVPDAGAYTGFNPVRGVKYFWINVILEEENPENRRKNSRNEEQNSRNEEQNSEKWNTILLKGTQL